MQKAKFNRQELLVYALMWGILFLAPVVAHYVSLDQDGNVPFGWKDVLFVWRQYALFFGVFLLHNFFLAPLLVERQRRWAYFSLVALLLTAFVVIQCTSRPEGMTRQEGQRPPMEHFDDVPPRPADDFPPADHFPPDGDFRPEDKRPPMPFGQHDVIAVILMILMLGMNLGVKLYFRQRRDRERLALLEKQNLEQQLEYLRYQLNPHFLMNTLNNIHALVDIDQERAKEAVLQLSKIMRFVLYEGSKPTVPLGRELAFTCDYIQLMRMRVTDRVRISVSMPEQTPDRQIPPLLLITFVENAFKHGVSYRQESFIDISVSADGTGLRFACRNSKVPTAEDQHGGVGLQNVRRRLDLIYGDKYSLRIDDEATQYNIELIIPL